MNVSGSLYVSRYPQLADIRTRWFYDPTGNNISCNAHFRTPEVPASSAPLVSQTRGYNTSILVDFTDNTIGLDVNGNATFETAVASMPARCRVRCGAA